MEQPTPPSPAASTDEAVSRKHMADAVNNPYSLNPMTPGENGESYSQGQLTYSPLVPEGNVSTYTGQFSGFVQPSQDIAFSTYPPPPSKSETVGAFYGSASGEAYNTTAFSRYTPETSPPAHSQVADSITTACNGQGIPTPTPTKCRTARERRAEKKNRDLRRRDPSNSIGKPLSQIAVELPQIAVPDAKAFATRPVEVRRAEAAEAGKIKRPLNAFMLYRRSYQNVAKTRCTRNNHQQVSAVCGDSWTSWEPPDIVGEFNRLAGIEKQMHEQAFPDYKYDPILAKKPGDDGDAMSSLASDTSDLEYGGRRRATKRNARKRVSRNAPRLNEPPLTGYEGYPEAVGMGPPLYGVPTPGPYWGSPALRPLPIPYDEEQLSYVDQGSYQEQVAGSIGEHMASRSPSPSTNCLDHNLMGQGLNFMDPSLDLSLLPGTSNTMAYDSMLHGASVDMQEEWCQQPDARQDIVIMMPDLDGGGSYNAYLKGNEQDWEIEQLGETSQFDDWIAQTEGGAM